MALASTRGIRGSPSQAELKRLATSYKYPNYPPTDLVIYSSCQTAYLDFDRSSNRFGHRHAPPGWTPKVIVYMIPGNPGIVEFYEQFLSKLCASLIDCEVVCTGHLGHSLRNNSNLDLRFLRNFRLGIAEKAASGLGDGTLQDHIDYHHHVLHNLIHRGMVGSAQTKLIVIGHSVGAYIGTKLLENYPDHVMHFIGLFPTVSQIGRSPNGLRLAPLFSPITLPFLNLMQIILSMLFIPQLLHHFLNFCFCCFNLNSKIASNKLLLKSKNIKLEQRKRLKANLRIILSFIFNINATSAVLKMARSEMKSILELDANLMRKFSRKITLCWTSEAADGWVGETEVMEIMELFEQCRIQNETQSIQSQTNLSDSQIKLKAIGLSEKTIETRHSWQPSTLEGVPQWRRFPQGVEHAYCLEHDAIVAKECSSMIKALLMKSKA